MSAEVKVCPHPSCDMVIKHNEYACKEHWLGLPKNMRDNIWKGYRESAGLWSRTDKQIKDHWDKNGEE